MSLLHLQRRMAEDVTRPLNADFSMQSEAQDGSQIAQIAETYIKPNDYLSSFERLEIYNRQYWFRVIGAIAEDFSALQAVVGSKRFDALALAYLKENPSTSFTLRDLGAKLPEWLEAHPEFAGRRHQLAVDVARLEWAYIESYDGASFAPLDESSFTHLTADSILTLQPHVQLLALRYPVDELVLAVHQSNPSVDILSNAASERKPQKRTPLPAMHRSDTYLAVHRFDNMVYYRRIDPEEYQLLYAIQQRASLSEAIEAAFAACKLTPEDQASRIQQYFAHSAELGWLCKSQTE